MTHIDLMVFMLTLLDNTVCIAAAMPKKDLK